MMTTHMPRISWPAISLLRAVWSMASTVVRVVMRMGRIRVLPVAMRAARRSMPPRRSWLV